MSDSCAPVAPSAKLAHVITAHRNDVGRPQFETQQQQRQNQDSNISAGEKFRALKAAASGTLPFNTLVLAPRHHDPALPPPHLARPPAPSAVQWTHEYVLQHPPPHDHLAQHPSSYTQPIPQSIAAQWASDFHAAMSSTTRHHQHHSLPAGMVGHPTQQAQPHQHRTPVGLPVYHQQQQPQSSRDEALDLTNEFLMTQQTFQKAQVSLPNAAVNATPSVMNTAMALPIPLWRPALPHPHPMTFRPQPMTHNPSQPLIPQETATNVETTIIGKNPHNALELAAAHLTDVVASSDNASLKQSAFAGFIKSIQDGDLVVKDGADGGQELVRGGSASGGSSAWASEFASQSLTTRQSETFASEYMSQSFQSTSAIPSSVQEAQKWASNQDPALNIDFRNWQEEFLKHQQARPQETSQEWQEEFAHLGRVSAPEQLSWSAQFQEAFHSSSTPQDMTDVMAKAFDEINKTDWASDFLENGGAGTRGENDALQQQWNALTLKGNAEQQEPPSSTAAATTARLETEYVFAENNPYMTRPMPFLTDKQVHTSLTESILAFEAAAQLEPTNAATWLALGTLQQESENEGRAISALRESVKLDSTCGEAWMGLAVSYTNENALEEAYDSLEAWLRHNPTYAGLLDSHPNSVAMSRHERLTKVFIQAARASQTTAMDPDVQMGLGVLFNISQEFAKATDCFSAALATRPQNYMLWNRLGATLANSSEPVRALDAYYNALSLNPSFVRARYNLAIACMQLNQHKEAAEHLLKALHIQGDDATGSILQSQSVWSTLRSLVVNFLNRPDLSLAVDERNLGAFRRDFDF